MTIHSGEEHTIWEGQSQSLSARATGGRLTLKYRLTTHYLYFETGGITGTKQEQVPLINVQDVDVNQTLVQKTQKVGNILVHIQRPTGPHETAVFDSVPNPQQVRDLINQTVHQVRAAAHQRQLAEQQQLNTHRYESTGPIRPGMPGIPAPVQAAPPQPAAPPAQSPEEIMQLLKQLGELRDAGIVTSEEFETKKAELLARL